MRADEETMSTGFPGLGPVTGVVLFCFNRLFVSIRRASLLEPELGVTAPFEGLETLVGNSLLCRSR